MPAERTVVGNSSLHHSTRILKVKETMRRAKQASTIYSVFSEQEEFSQLDGILIATKLMQKIEAAAIFIITHLLRCKCYTTRSEPK
jgi:hypothetical protein